MERSLSPSTRPPTPSAPGPRATALQKLYADAIAHILRTCSYPNFAACFPTPARQVPASMKELHQQFNEKLGQQLKSNFDAILSERDVIGSLNELDRLVEEAKRRRERAEAEGRVEDGTEPAHTLPAQQLYLAHLSPSLAEHSREMKEKQEGMRAENAEILERVIRQRKEIASIMKGVESVVTELDASVAALREEDLDSLKLQSVEVDGQMDGGVR